MSQPDRNTFHPRKKSGKLRYFFLDGEWEGKTQPLLHKSLHINRSQDTIITWCYPLTKRVVYTYSDTKKHRDPAFTTKEAAAMLNRGHLALERGILSGGITEPQYTYGIDERKNKFQYMWHENYIMEAHAYLSTIHFGRPRNDGLIAPKAMPTVRELRALIRNEQVLYVKNGDDQFVPVWRAENFE
jgi:hypothetical protein